MGPDVMRRAGQSWCSLAIEWVWAVVAAAAAAAGRGVADESVGIVGIEVPIILRARTNTHAPCQSRYINAQ